jgi:hypothetical protein
VAYRAEIEISVKGARQLREVTGQIEQLAERVDLVSANFKPFIQTLAQFESNLSRTATTLRRVRTGTDDEVTAIKQYVQALGEANTARARQNNLIQQELALQEAAKRKTEPGSTGFSRAQYGPALPPAFIKQQEDQQNFKRLFADLNETAKVISVSNTNTKTSWQKAFEELNETAKAISVNRLNTQTSWRKAFEELNETAKAISVSRLNTQTSWQRTFKELNETAKAISVSRSNVKSSWTKALSDLEEVATDISKAAERERRQTRNRARKGTVAAGRRRQQRTRDATSNAIIGGAFPLLFGQGIGASVGGAAGGGLGGLAGGQFGFGLSLVGTAVGTAVDNLIKSTSELGKALNPLTADIGAVTAAAGESGTAFEQLIQDIEKVAGKEKALAVATAQLATVIGTDGVAALRKLGSETTDLGNEVSKALSLAGFAVAEFVNQTGLLAALINGIDTANLKKLADRNTTDPELQRLKEARANITPATANPTLSFAGITIASDLEDQIDAADAAIVARQRQIQVEEQLNIKIKARAEIAAVNAAKSRDTLRITENELAISRTNAGLENDKVFALRLQGIELKKNEEINANILALNSKQITRAQALAEQTAINNRAEAARNKAENNRKNAQNRTAEKAANDAKRLAREAEQAAKKAAQLEASLNSERAQQLQLGNQSIAIEFGEKIALQDKLVVQKDGLSLIEKIYNFKREQIKLTTEDAALEKERLATLALQEKIETDTTKQKLEQLNIAERLAALQSQQDVDSTRTGLNQELGGLALGLTPDLELANEQANRLQNTIKGLDDQLARLEEQRTGVLNPQLESAIKGIQGQKEAYQELLPQIFAAEQQQLKYNQALAAVTPGVNALVGGLRDVIAGTKSAEEAFADFLNTIADQLIQTAATLIAQYIAIGLAKAFAGLSGGSSGLDFNTSAPSITGNSLGDFGGGTPFAGAFRANGGPVSANQPYIVGERGMELFVPQTSGTVLSNEDSRAALAKYSPGNNLLSEAGDSTGTVAGRNETLNPVINISTGPTLQFEGEGYVKQEDFKAGLARAAQEGAKQGQTLTLRKLMMSPTARSKIGI